MIRMGEKQQSTAMRPTTALVQNGLGYLLSSDLRHANVEAATHGVWISLLLFLLLPLNRPLEIV